MAGLTEGVAISLADFPAEAVRTFMDTLAAQLPAHPDDRLSAFRHLLQELGRRACTSMTERRRNRCVALACGVEGADGPDQMDDVERRSPADHGRQVHSVDLTLEVRSDQGI